MRTGAAPSRRRTRRPRAARALRRCASSSRGHDTPVLPCRPAPPAERTPSPLLKRAFSFSGPNPGRRAMQKDVLLTPEGLDKLKAEIEYLSNNKRREVAERIKEAREFGDISENSEYDDAKNEQAMLEAR